MSFEVGATVNIFRGDNKGNSGTITKSTPDTARVQLTSGPNKGRTVKIYKTSAEVVETKERRMGFEVGAIVNIFKGDNKGSSGTITKSTPDTAQVKLTSGPNKGRTVKIYKTSAEVVETKKRVESPVLRSPVTSSPYWDEKSDPSRVGFAVGATVNIFKGDNKGNSGTITKSTPDTAQVKLTSGPNKGRTVKIYRTSAEVVETKQRVESPVPSPVTSRSYWDEKSDPSRMRFEVGTTVNIFKGDNKGSAGTVTKSTPDTAQVKLTSGPNKGRTVKIYKTSAEVVVQTKKRVESPVLPSPVTSRPYWDEKRDECYYEAQEGLVVGDMVKVISRDSKYFKRTGSVIAVTGKDIRVALFASDTSNVALVTKHQSELKRVESAARVLFP